MIIKERTFEIEMVRGDSEVLQVKMEDETGLAIPFATGDTVYLTIKTDANTATKILQKTVTSFTDGVAVFTIAPADTSALTYGTYLYDIQWTKSGGTTKKTLVKPSQFIIGKEVTYE